MFWLSLAAGAVFTLAGIGLSFAVADFYGEPQVAPLFIVFSFGFVLTSLSATIARSSTVRWTSGGSSSER